MHTAIGGVGTRAHGGGVGHPHARSRATGDQQRHGLLGRLLNDLRIRSGKAQATQRSHIRTLLRGEHALLEAHVHQRLHLRQALQRRFFRIGALLAIALGGDVAVGQTAVVMGRPH